jgi:hypothetical protein
LRPSATNIVTTGLNTSISIIRNRQTTSNSERVAEPLSLLYNFSSSFTSNRHRPPFPLLKPPEPPAEPHCHNQASTTLGNPLLLSFFFFFFFISLHLHCSRK